MSRPTGEPVLQAEQAVIGAVLLDPEYLPHVNLKPADFLRAEHRRIFEALLALDADGAAVDAVVVAERTSLSLDRLVDIAESCMSPENAGAYADIVRGAARRRQALSAIEEARLAIDRGDRALADVIADLAASTESLAADTGSGPVTMSEVLTRAIESATEARARRREGGTIGAPSGIPALDSRLGGLHGPRLVIPAARPGTGKTALMYQWAQHAAARGFRVGIVSLEMSDTESGLRTLAVATGLNAAALARGSADEFERLQAAMTANKVTPIRNFPIFWEFDAFSLGSIVARISAWRRTERIDFAVIDHIGLIEAEGYKSRVEQLGAISRTLKKLAKRLDIPIVAVSQLSRANEKDKRLPQLSDLRDSGNLEQDADVVLMLNATGEPDKHGVVEVEIGILKCRDGVRGWLPSKFEFDGRTQRFHEVDARSEYGPAAPRVTRRVPP